MCCLMEISGDKKKVGQGLEGQNIRGKCGHKAVVEKMAFGWMLEKWRIWPQSVEKGCLGRRITAVMTLWRLEWAGGWLVAGIPLLKLEWWLCVDQGGPEKTGEGEKGFWIENELIWVSIEQDQYGCCVENRLRGQGQKKSDQFLSLL